MATGLKKKFNQHDLRRLMSVQKAKSAPKTNTTTINSPLAKYPFHKKIAQITSLNSRILFSLTEFLLFLKYV